MAKRVGLSKEIPLLSIVYHAAGGFPIVVEVREDWKKTGAVYIFCQDLERGRRAADVLEFALNALADELISRLLPGEVLPDIDDEDVPF